LVLRCSGYLSH